MPHVYVIPTVEDWNKLASIHIIWSCLKIQPGDGAALSKRIHGVWRMAAEDRSKDCMVLQGELDDDSFPGDGTVMFGPEPIIVDGRAPDNLRFMYTTMISRDRINKLIGKD